MRRVKIHPAVRIASFDFFLLSRTEATVETDNVIFELAPANELVRLFSNRETYVVMVPRVGTITTIPNAKLTFSSHQNKSMFCEDISENLKIAVDKWVKDNKMTRQEGLEKLAKRFEVSIPTIKNMLRTRRNSGRKLRLVSADEIRVLEDEFMIDRDEILGKRASPYPRRSILRRIDEQMKMDGDVEEEMVRLLRRWLYRMERSTKQERMKLCDQLSQALQADE